MEVSSSAEIAYSSAPSGAPSKVRAYGSSPRAALGRRTGSRKEIQDWNCQGLSASCLSQRRTVELEIDPTMGWATTSLDGSGHDQRNNGAPVPAGN